MPASSLQANLRRDVDRSTTNTSKYLCDNNLRGGGSGGSEGDHEPVSEDVDGDTGHHPPFVMAGVLDCERDNDGDCGGGEGESVGDVTCLLDGVVADNLEPGVEVCSGEVEGEEIEEPKSAGTTDAIPESVVFPGAGKTGEYGLRRVRHKPQAHHGLRTKLLCHFPSGKDSQHNNTKDNQANSPSRLPRPSSNSSSQGQWHKQHYQPCSQQHQTHQVQLGSGFPDNLHPAAVGIFLWRIQIQLLRAPVCHDKREE